MRNLKLYLETSVWNFYYADDAPEKKEVTRNFFENLPVTKYEIYASVTVLDEFEKASPKKKAMLTEMITTYSPTILTAEPAVADLAREYLEHKALPTTAEVDAYHIAFASANELDFIVSWNLRHIANVRRQEKVQAVNLLNGYTKAIQMITPMEVSDREQTED